MNAAIPAARPSAIINPPTNSMIPATRNLGLLISRGLPSTPKSFCAPWHANRRPITKRASAYIWSEHLLRNFGIAFLVPSDWMHHTKQAALRALRRLPCDRRRQPETSEHSPQQSAGPGLHIDHGSPRDEE